MGRYTRQRWVGCDGTGAKRAVQVASGKKKDVVEFFARCCYFNPKYRAWEKVFKLSAAPLKSEFASGGKADRGTHIDEG